MEQRQNVFFFLVSAAVSIGEVRPQQWRREGRLCRRIQEVDVTDRRTISLEEIVTADGQHPLLESSFPVPTAVDGNFCLMSSPTDRLLSNTRTGGSGRVLERRSEVRDT